MAETPAPIRVKRARRKRCGKCSTLVSTALVMCGVVAVQPIHCCPMAA